MRKSLHNSLSRGTVCAINADLWSSNKAKIHPNRSEVNANSFTETRKTCIRRALLEFERRFFDNKTELTFAELNSECDMNLSNREIALLVLEKSFCWRRSVFNNVSD